MSDPVIFILGAGPGIGQSVAETFAARGYKVALAARNVQEGIGADGFFRVKLDLSQTASVGDAFVKVEKQVGIPSVVVYNAALRVPLDGKDPLSSFSLEQVQEEFAVNTLSPLLAAKHAVAGFKKLPESASKTFIFTGNKLNVLILPEVTTFAAGKTATSQLMRYAATIYKEQGFRFYYADERRADGSPTVPVGGPAAGEAYLELAERKDQGPWLYTFVNGKGYHDFKELGVQ